MHIANRPQEYAEKRKIIEFYSRLDQEIKNAKILDCLICIQMDSNAKLGFEVIKGDIHSQSENGEILDHIITSNDLFLCNADAKCEGLFTRGRETIKGKKGSIIDYFIICEGLLKYFVKMKIDSDNALSKYSKVKSQIKITKSDHHLLICSFNLRVNKNIENKQQRIEKFNFNDPSGW